MEFAIKVLIVIVLAVITLMILIVLLGQSTGTGIGLIDGLFNFFRTLLPGGGTQPAQPSQPSGPPSEIRKEIKISETLIGVG